MALRLLAPGEAARNMGNMVWIEDLDKRSLSYGDLLAFLEGLHMPLVCSPIHDKDVYTNEDVRGWCERHIDPDTGDVCEDDRDRQPRVGDHKKPHVHIYYKFKGPRKPVQIARYWERFVPEVTSKRFVEVPDFDAMVRYCAHLDAPNKAPYDANMIHGFANVDMGALWEDSHFNKAQMLFEIHKAIEDHHIPNYKRLVLWARDTGSMDYLNYVTGRTSHFSAYFRDEQAERQAKKEAEKASTSDVEIGGELIG